MSWITAKPPRKRLCMLLGVGLMCVAAAAAHKHAQRPAPAPVEVQESGRAIIRQELERISASEFGQSERGRMLLDEIRRLLKADRIVFSAELPGKRGLSWREKGGTQTVFIMVLEMNGGKYLHQLPFQVSEALFHEAVHSLKSGVHGSCIEEECDGFAAGLTAQMVSIGVELPELFTMDGMPLGEFVASRYPELCSNPDYKPVGRTIEWLRKQARLGEGERVERMGVRE
jgi:hypothetical protein